MGVEYFRHTDGSVNIPIADGTVTLEGISVAASNHQVHIAFYAADGETLATPTAGTVTVKAGLIPDQYLAAATGGTIDATTVEAGDATYDPVVFAGPVFHAKITKASLATAVFMRAYVWSDG